MSITTKRTELVGGHVTPEVKTRLQRTAQKRGMSVSRLIYKILLKTFKMKDTEYEA